MGLARPPAAPRLRRNGVKTSRNAGSGGRGSHRALAKGKKSLGGVFALGTTSMGAAGAAVPPKKSSSGQGLQVCPGSKTPKETPREGGVPGWLLPPSPVSLPSSF